MCQLSLMIAPLQPHTALHSLTLRVYNYPAKICAEHSLTQSASVYKSKIHQFIINYYSEMRTRNQYCLCTQSYFRLVIADTKLGTTTQVCTGSRGTAEGDRTTCQLDAPHSLIHYGDSLYVGANGVLMQMEGNFIKLFLLVKI